MQHSLLQILFNAFFTFQGPLCACIYAVAFSIQLLNSFAKLIKEFIKSLECGYSGSSRTLQPTLNTLFQLPLPTFKFYNYRTSNLVVTLRFIFNLKKRTDCNIYRTKRTCKLLVYRLRWHWAHRPKVLNQISINKKAC